MENFAIPENNMFSTAPFLIPFLLFPFIINHEKLDEFDIARISLIEDPSLREEEKLKFIQKAKTTIDKEVVEELPKFIDGLVNLDFIENEQDKADIRQAFKDKDYDKADKIMKRITEGKKKEELP